MSILPIVAIKSPINFEWTACELEHIKWTTKIVIEQKDGRHQRNVVQRLTTLRKQIDEKVISPQKPYIENHKNLTTKTQPNSCAPKGCEVECMHSYYIHVSWYIDTIQYTML